MALTTRAIIQLVFRAVLRPNGGVGGGAVAEVVVDEAFANGNDDRQATSTYYVAAQSIGAAATITVDLSTIANANGTVINPAEIAAIFVRATETNGDTVTMDTGVTNGWTGWVDGTIVLRPGEWVAASFPLDGGPLVDATHKAIAFTNDDGANAQSIEFFILTRSA